MLTSTPSLAPTYMWELVLHSASEVSTLVSSLPDAMAGKTVVRMWEDPGEAVKLQVQLRTYSERKFAMSPCHRRVALPLIMMP